MPDLIPWGVEQTGDGCSCCVCPGAILEGESVGASRTKCGIVGFGLAAEVVGGKMPDDCGDGDGKVYLTATLVITSAYDFEFSTHDASTCLTLDYTQYDTGHYSETRTVEYSLDDTFLCAGPVTTCSGGGGLDYGNDATGTLDCTDGCPGQKSGSIGEDNSATTTVNSDCSVTCVGHKTTYTTDLEDCDGNVDPGTSTTTELDQCIGPSFGTCVCSSSDTSITIDCPQADNGATASVVLTLSDEYTTAALISNTTSVLPDLPGSFTTGDIEAIRDLSDDEATFSISKAQYRFRYPVTGTGCFKIEWVERFTAADGAVTDTPKTFSVSGATPPGGYSDTDPTTWPTTDAYPLPVPATDGSLAVAAVTSTCACDE